MQEKKQFFSPLKQRILQYLDNQDGSKRQLLKKCGISRGTLESNTSITEKTLTKFFATFKDVNPEWIRTGDGEMISSDYGHKSYLKTINEPETIYGKEKSDLEILKKIILNEVYKDIDSIKKDITLLRKEINKLNK